MLHTRQTAWYAATPEGGKLSRMELMKNPVVFQEDEDNPAIVNLEEAQEIPFPEIPEGAEYLVSFLHSAGTATQTGMGLVPLSWQEIESWAYCSGLQESLSVWELEVIKILSDTYASQYSKSSSKNCPQPFNSVVDKKELDRKIIGDKVSSILSFLKVKT